MAGKHYGVWFSSALLVGLIWGSPVGATTAQQWLEQGMAALQQRQFDRAVQLLQQGVDAYPGSVSLWRALGLAQFRGGNVRGAIQTLRAGQERFPGDPDLHINLGWYLHVSGDNPAAKTTLETAIQLDPQRKEGFNL